MTEPYASWSDPLHQVALRAMIRAGAAPYRVTDDASDWILDATRSARVFYVGEQSLAAVDRLVRDLASRFPAGGVDIVCVGGNDGVRNSMHNALDGVKARGIGLTHLGADGKVWTEGAHASIKNAFEAMLANGVPSAEPAESLARDMAIEEEVGRARVDALRTFSQRLKGEPAYATMIMIAAMAVIFAGEWMFGKASVPTLIRMGACVAERVKHGEPWRVLSSALLHANIVHIGFNSASLFSLGGLYERVIGRGRYLTLFVAAAIGAGIASTIASPNAVMVGASGGIFGLLGASAAIALRPRDLFPADMMPKFRRDVVANLALMVVYSLQPGVSWPAHLGGGIVGFLLMISGVVAPDRKRSASSTWKIPGAIAAAMLVASFALALAKGKPWVANRATWSRQTLAGTTLSAELPGPMRVQPRPDAVREYDTEVLDDGFEVSVLVEATDALETPEERGAAAEQIRARPGGLAHPPEMQLAGAPQTTIVNGFPTVTQDATASNGVRFRNWFQIRAHSVISVQMSAREDAARAVDDVPRRILASITGDP